MDIREGSGEAVIVGWAVGSEVGSAGWAPGPQAIRRKGGISSKIKGRVNEDFIGLSIRK